MIRRVKRRIPATVATVDGSVWHDGGVLPEDTAGPVIQSVLDGLKVVEGVQPEVGALGEVLAKQSVSVLIGAAQPRGSGWREYTPSAKW
jgi:hypothetical protein